MGGGGSGGQHPIELVITCCKRQKIVVTLRLQTNMIDALHEVIIDGQVIYYSKFNLFVNRGAKQGGGGLGGRNPPEGWIGAAWLNPPPRSDFERTCCLIAHI